MNINTAVLSDGNTLRDESSCLILLVSWDILSRWKYTIKQLSWADSITFHVWLAPSKRGGDMHIVTPFRHAAIVLKTRVLLPPVGLTPNNILIMTLLSYVRSNIVPMPDCHC